MTTLCIGEVPAPVAETLKARAAAQGQSLSAYANARLATIAARPTNAEIVGRLRDRDRSDGVPAQRSADEILAALR